MSGSGSGRIVSFDGLRGVMFLWVFAYHCRPGTAHFLTYSLPVFFILSGYLIGGLLLEADESSPGRSLVRFYLRRALRILPAFYLVAGLMWAAGCVRYPAWTMLYGFNVKLFLLSLADNATEWSPLMNSWRASEIHLWSLAVEEQFYLVAPAFALWVPRSRRSAWIAAAAAACSAFRFWAAYRFPGTAYGALPFAAGEYFFWGYLLASLSRDGALDGLNARKVLNLSLSAFVLLLAFDSTGPHPHEHQFRTCWVQAPFAAAGAFFIWSVARVRTHPVVSILSIPALAGLGRMSYGLYLVHLPMFPAWKLLAGYWSPLKAIPFPIGAFALSIAAAAAMWFSFEKRVNNWRRGII